MEETMPEEVHEQPSVVKAVDGTVSVDGPDGVSVVLSAEAAEETSERLLEGALTARGQSILRKARESKSS